MISETVVLLLVAVTVFIFFGRLAELLLKKHRNRVSMEILRTNKTSKPEASPVEHDYSSKVGPSGQP
jgi:hypothetical protein